MSAIAPLATGRARKALQKSMRIVTSEADALAILDHEPGYISLDLETTGLHFTTDKIAVVAMYGPASNTAAILHVRGQGLSPTLVRWLSDPRRQFITHNGTSFDLGFLMAEGVAWRQPTWFDTLIGEQVALTTNRRDVKVNLKATLERRLGVVIPKDISHETWMLPELSEDHLRYLADDIFYLPYLRQSQLDRAREQDDRWQQEGELGVCDAMDFEQRLAPVVAGMTMRGMPIDLDALHAYVTKQNDELPEHRAWLIEQLGTENLNYSPAVRDAANRAFGLKLTDTTADTLKVMANAAKSPADCLSPAQEFAYRMLRYRHATKRESMYDERFEEKYVRAGRVYGTFRQCGTDTGRFSSWNPNLQQLPRDMRHVFADPTGELAYVAIDYSAIEVRIAAALYQDKALLAAIETEDVHSTVAEIIFGEWFKDLPRDSPERAEMRRIAKASSFTLTFGGGFQRMYNYALVNGSTSSYAQIESAGRTFLIRFPGIERARQTAYWKADQRRAVPITQPNGLRRVLSPELNAKGNTDLKGTTILNTAVQGCAAIGLKHALFLLDDAGISQYLSAVLHDEIVMTPPKALANDVANELERCMIAGMAEVTDAPVATERKGGERWG